MRGEEVHPLAVEVIEETDIDLGDHYPKELRKFWGRRHFGCQITVCKREEERELNCPIYPEMGLKLSWPFDDPRAFEGTEEERLQKFREVRDEIDDRIRFWIEEREAVSGR